MTNSSSSATRVCVKDVLVCDPSSEWNGKTVSLLLADGILADIGIHIELPENVQTIEQEGLIVCPAFFDLSAKSGEPGYERSEDLESVSRAALRGGFSALALMPETEPPLYSKSQIEFITARSANLPVDMYPVGTISHKREGKDMAELYDMFLSGARAFSDGDRPVQQSGLMMRALQYVSDFGGLVMACAEDASLAAGAKVHEGIESLKLGMKGIPSIAEELMISRDIMLASYTGTRIHFTALSSAGSVNLVREAKKQGLRVTASVAAHQLILDDSFLQSFNSNYKVKPPLRTAADREALVAGLVDGTIDAVCSMHNPQETEYKHVEFETAHYGIIGLETAYSLTNEALSVHVSQEKIIQLLSAAPRSIFGLPAPVFEKGKPCTVSLIRPGEEWVLQKKDLGSKSSNSPFLGRTLRGRIHGVYTAGSLHRFSF